MIMGMGWGNFVAYIIGAVTVVLAVVYPFMASEGEWVEKISQD